LELRLESLRADKTVRSFFQAIRQETYSILCSPSVSLLFFSLTAETLFLLAQDAFSAFLSFKRVKGQEFGPANDHIIKYRCIILLPLIQRAFYPINLVKG